MMFTFAYILSQLSVNATWLNNWLFDGMSLVYAFEGWLGMARGMFFVESSFN